MIKWHIEIRKIKDLCEHPKNPRTLTKDQAYHLEKSLDKFGLIDKPIINIDGMIIGGHQRLNILKKMGYKQIECWVPDEEMQKNDVDELCIRLNKNTGEFCWDTLANNWDTDCLIDFGFTESELLDEKVVSKKKSLKIILEFDDLECMENCIACDEFEKITHDFDPQIKVKK